jgi:hypothetical protein
MKNATGEAPGAGRSLTGAQSIAPPLENPKGIPSFSPGLERSDYPGSSPCNTINLHPQNQALAEFILRVANPVKFHWTSQLNGFIWIPMNQKYTAILRLNSC